MHVKSISSDVRKKARTGSKQCSKSSFDGDIVMSHMESGGSFLFFSFLSFFFGKILLLPQ